MILTDFQIQYGQLLMGPGTPYDVVPGRTGLLDLPSIRASDTLRARGDGAWEGEEFADPQTFALSVEIYQTPGIPLGLGVRTFLDETTPRVGRDLWFKLPHLLEPRRLVGVRVRRRAVPQTFDFDQVVRAELDLYAADPARYGAEQTLTALAGTRDAVAGVNQGDLDAWPVFYLSRPGLGFSGPVSIVHEQTGSVIAISTPVVGDQVLVIDPSVGTAIVDYYADRGEDLSSRQWWAIPPRGSFTARLSAPQGVRMDVVWRPSWW